NRTYTPVPDFNGSDTFTFHVNDGRANSNTATVTVTVLEVNDAPNASNDDKSTDEDTAITFPVSDLTANDNPGPGNESSQTLTVSEVDATADTHGTVTFAAGQVTYTPDPNFNGPATFTYRVCDNGITVGQADPQCSTATVNVTVNPVNDPPVLSGVPSSATTPEETAYAFTAHGSDADGDALTFSLVGAPAGATIDPSTGQFTWTPTEAQGGTGAPYVFKVHVSDGIANTDAGISVSVTEVNRAPVIAAIGNKTVSLGSAITFTASATDPDIPVQTLTYSLAGAVPAGAAINGATGVFTWTPSGAQAGLTFSFGVVASDGAAATSTPVAISVIDTTPPSISALSLSTTQLWPPNHKMVVVAVAYSASDLGDPSPACTLAVISNEPVNGTGDGDTAPDWEIVDGHHVRLRAERAGTGRGRIYTVTATCSDRFGNTAQSSSAAVVVPKNQGK
ncbi:MAG: tandem-95 repeat protein, partial [Thermoanaerobaculia bacterium]